MKKMSEAIGMMAYSIEEGILIGTVQDFLFDMSDGSIQGWVLKSPHFFSKRGGVSTKEVRIIGKDIMLINREQVVEWTYEKESKRTGFCWGSDYVSIGFWDRGGQEIGRVEDMILSERGDKIKGFLLQNGDFVSMGEHCRLGRDSAVLSNVDKLIACTEEETGTIWKKIKKILDHPKD